MIRAERIQVGREPIDLTEKTGLSGVTVQWVRNAGEKGTLFLGGDENGENGIPIGPGETGPQGLALGSTDHLHVRAEVEGDDEDATLPVDVVLGWT